MVTAEISCFHCGEPVPSDVHIQLELNGQLQRMCCQGCLAVASLISSAGLGRFYQFRQQVGEKVSADVEQTSRAWQALDERESLWGELNSSGFHDLLLQVTGIRCAACAWLIRSHLEKQSGIHAVQVNISTGYCRIQWTPEYTRLSKIAECLFELGYTPHLPLAQAEEEGRRKERLDSQKRLGVAGLGMMQVMMYAVGLYAGEAYGISPAERAFLGWVSLLVSFPVLLYSGRVFFQGAWRGLRSGRPGMDLPVSLAIGLAFLASCVNFFRGNGEIWFDSVVMFIFFLSLGRHVELVLRQQNLQAGTALARLLPEWADLLDTEDRITVVPALDLVPGDRVRVKTGDPFPADGAISAGETEVDEALITGEAKALPRMAGDKVIAGSINLSQCVEVTVEVHHEESTVSALGRMLLTAQSRRSEESSLPAWLIPGFITVVLATALGSWWFWLAHDAEKAFSVALAVLVASCPCALSLALPVVRSAASMSLLHEGILLTRTTALFELLNVQTVIFDKTGTLTQGQPEIDRVQLNPSRPEFNESRVLGLAAAMESHSNHPLARAFRVFDAAPGISEVHTVPGMGLKANLGGQNLRLGRSGFAHAQSLGEPLDDDDLWLSDQHGWIARIKLVDALRAGAREAITDLKNRGLELRICSGDSSGAVADCARRLNIEHWAFRQGPEDKITYINDLKNSGKNVLMVGDGVNDGPVLAAANVSMTVHGASDVANSAADFILTGISLDGLRRSFITAQKAKKLVKQNLGWALLYNASVMPLAVSGWLQPWMAALGMSASSLLVVLNATRMKKEKSDVVGADVRSGSFTPATRPAKNLEVNSP